MTKGGFEQNAFEGADRGPLKDVWEKKILPFMESIPNDQEGLLSYVVSHPDSTLFISVATAIASEEYMNCELMPLPGEYWITYMAFGIQKNSPYGEVLNYFLRRLTEGGSVAKLQLKYLGSAALNCKRSGSGQPIGLETALPAIMIMIAGIITSALLFLIEVLFKLFA